MTYPSRTCWIEEDLRIVDLRIVDLRIVDFARLGFESFRELKKCCRG